MEGIQSAQNDFTFCCNYFKKNSKTRNETKFQNYFIYNGRHIYNHHKDNFTFCYNYFFENLQAGSVIKF